MMKKIIKLCLALMVTGNGIAVLAGSKTATIWSEDFESDNWKKAAVSNVDTATKLVIAEPGQLSKRCLSIVKPDYCGYLTYCAKVKIPSSSAGHWALLSADLKTVYKGAYAEYYMMVCRKAKGKRIGPNEFFAFDDGIARKTKFGGQFKTPQTFGEWKKTIHQFKITPDTDTLEITIVIRGGAQNISFDNLKLVDIGPLQQPPPARLVYEKAIDWPYGMLTLDTLLPGATYRIEADILRPDPARKLQGLTPNPRLSQEKAPSGSVGMGIAMKYTNLHNIESKPVQLPELPDRNGLKIFQLTVPGQAMKVLLDLHNDDLVRFNHNQIEPQARRWGTVRVYLENFGEIAADNAYWQYVYRGKPSHLKVRNWIDIDPFDLDVLKNRLLKRPDAEMKVGRYNGGMCFILNGKPTPPMLMSSAEPATSYRLFTEGAKNGMNLLFVRYPYGGVSNHGDWQGPGKYDFSDLDSIVYKVLIQNPKACVVLSLSSLYPPDWWSVKNRDQLARTQDGKYVYCTATGLYRRTFGSFDKLEKVRKAIGSRSKMHKIRGAGRFGHYLPSPAASKCRALMADYLTALRKHVEKQPYGRAVVGYRLLWGYDSQWGAVRQDYSAKNTAFLDYSQPMLSGFRKFLKEKYHSPEQLRKAWNKPDVSFENAAIPAITNRNIDQRITQKYLLDPKIARDVIDFREYLGQTRAETLLNFCRAIKDAGDKDVITAAYFPDIATSCTGGAFGSSRGNNLVINSELFDAAGGPSYEARGIGLPCKSNVMLNSYPLHNKIHLCEIDHRVFPVAKRNYANNLLFDTPRKSISVLRREYMKQMCFGSGSWTFDMGFGWYNDPLIASILGQAHNVFSGVLEKDRSSIAQIAMFAGFYGKFVQGDARRGTIPKMQVSRAKILTLMSGVPVDQYLIKDLPAVAEKYRIFYFPFAYGLSQDDIRNIEKLKTDGNILVFGYGAGLVSNELSVENVAKLTGMKLKTDPGQSLTLQFVPGHKITKGLTGFMGTGGDFYLEAGMPRIYVDDPQATTLGRFIKSGKTAMAIKDHGSWKSIYVGVIGMMPPDVLRNIAKYAGLHIYNQQNDVMFFNKSLIAIHASSTGMKTIELPQKADVTSLWDNKKAGSLKTIKRFMQTGENALYLIEP